MTKKTSPTKKKINNCTLTRQKKIKTKQLTKEKKQTTKIYIEIFFSQVNN